MHLDDPRRFVARQPFQAPIYRGLLSRPLATCLSIGSAFREVKVKVGAGNNFGHGYGL